jgi:hypothetical protein
MKLKKNSRIKYRDLAVASVCFTLVVAFLLSLHVKLYHVNNTGGVRYELWIIGLCFSYTNYKSIARRSAPASEVNGFIYDDNCFGWMNEKYRFTFGFDTR